MTLEDKIRSGRMTFGDAMEAVTKGYAVRRASWKEDEYVTLGYERELEKVTDEGRRRNDYTHITVLDLNAEDWHVTGEHPNASDSGQLLMLDEEHRDKLIAALRSGERGKTSVIEYEGVRIEVHPTAPPNPVLNVQVRYGPIFASMEVKKLEYDFGSLMLSDGKGRGHIITIAVDPYCREARH